VSVKLHPVIQEYVEASNRHHPTSILACFSNEAVLHDEGETLRGKEAIKGWITRTIEKYRFQFKPIGVRDDSAEVIVQIEVSGTFPGSPVTLDYHFTIGNEKILSLRID
jgi:SnoaL-like protein